MKRLLESWLGNSRKPSATLPSRCRWERVPAGSGRSEWIIVCPPKDPDDAAPAPVLYLLHGSGHSPLSYFSELQMEPLLPLAENACLVFVEGGKGWYLNSPVDAASQREEAFLRTLEWVESRFPVGQSRECRGICGFSMGGFGAMHLASRHPETFGSASSIIGPLNIGPLWPGHPGLRALLGADWDAWQANNPAVQAARLAGVRLLATTATQAWDRPLNESFAERCRAQGVDITLREYPGDHGMDFTAARLREHLEFHIPAAARPSSWIIRPARMDDAPALSRNCFTAMGEDGTARHLDWTLRETAQGRRVHLVADAGEAVGNGELSLMGIRAEIANLVVAGPLQSRGIGTAIIHALTDAAMERGVRILEIGVRTRDTRTKSLYESVGFAPFQESTRHIAGEPVSVTYLRKTLNPISNGQG